MINIAICDDDLTFLDYFEKKLAFYFSNQNCDITVKKFSSGKSLIESVEKDKKIYDVIFLDIDMPSLNGFQAAYRLRQHSENLLLIFTTNLDNEMQKGYYYRAFRFILKNRLDEDVKEAVQAIISKLTDMALSDETVSFKYKLENGYDSITVKKKDIVLLEIIRRRVILKTVYGEYDLLVLPLNEYKNQLSADNFTVVTRSRFINMEHVTDIDGGNIYMTGEIKVFIGDSKQAQTNFRKCFMTYKNKYRKTRGSADE